MPGFRFLFRTPKHQQFQYKPMHYDARKEELKERLAELERLKENGLEGTKARISSGIRRGYLADQDYRKKQIMRSNLTLVLIVIMLIVLGYLLLDVYLPEITQMLE